MAATLHGSQQSEDYLIWYSHDLKHKTMHTFVVRVASALDCIVSSRTAYFQFRAVQNPPNSDPKEHRSRKLTLHKYQHFVVTILPLDRENDHVS